MPKSYNMQHQGYFVSIAMSTIVERSEISGLASDVKIALSDLIKFKLNHKQWERNRYFQNLPADSEIECAIDLCETYENGDLTIIPSSAAEMIVSALRKVRIALPLPEQHEGDSLEDFMVKAENACSEIQGAFESLFNLAAPWIAYYGYSHSKTGQASKAVEQLEKRVGDSERLYQKITRIVSAAQAASATIGIGHFAARFKIQARLLEKEAKWWLIATVTLACSSILAALAFYCLLPLSAQPGLPEVINVLTTKALVLALLVSATLWCGRIFKATKHQAAINWHRANALRSFQTFVNATDDPAVRDGVLTEASRSIFSLTASGYLDSADSNTLSAGKAVDLVKAASSALK